MGKIIHIKSWKTRKYVLVHQKLENFLADGKNIEIEQMQERAQAESIGKLIKRGLLNRETNGPLLLHSFPILDTLFRMKIQKCLVSSPRLFGG